jgi:serine/threonine kinase 3
MIPTRPPPTFKNPDEWSPSFVDLIAQCLVKEPDKRKTATELLQVLFSDAYLINNLYFQHDFIRNARGSAILVDMINDAQEIAASHAIRDNNGVCLYLICNSTPFVHTRYFQYYDSDSVDSTTMVQSHNAPGIHHNRQSGDDDEAVAIDDGTLINRQIYVHEQFHTANSGEIAHQFNSLHLSPNGGGQYDAADVNHQGSMRSKLP